jgi:hypothetical protein
MSGWSLGLQTLIVAHSWREERTELAARAFAVCPAAAAAAAELAASRAASAEAAAKGLLADRLPDIKIKIAPDLAPR